MRISDWSSDVCSSDLARPPVPVAAARYNYRERPAGACTTRRPWRRELRLSCGQGFVGRRAAYVARSRAARGFDCAELACVSRYNRSEEHTSELQSLMRISYAVFCLKKKTKQHN